MGRPGRESSAVNSQAMIARSSYPPSWSDVTTPDNPLTTTPSCTNAAGTCWPAPGAGTVAKVTDRLRHPFGNEGQELERSNLRAPRTSFNGRVSPHRRFTFGQIPLDDVKEIKNAHGVTVNDVVVEGTRRPFEVFINSKNMEHYAWTVALTRMISAVFRRGGEVAFVVDELKAVFDPRGGAWMAGRYVPSILAAIGIEARGLVLQAPPADQADRR